MADETALPDELDPDTRDPDHAPLTDTSDPDPGAEPEECPDEPADPIEPPDPVGIADPENPAPLEKPNSPADDVDDPPG